MKVIFPLTQTLILGTKAATSMNMMQKTSPSDNEQYALATEGNVEVTHWGKETLSLAARSEVEQGTGVASRKFRWCFGRF